MNRAAEKRVIKARSILVIEQPFYGCLALHLTIQERPEIDTCATDGKRFFYNPQFVLEITEAELKGVWAHEVAHCALKHHARMGNRDLREFNSAADLAINPDLLRQGFKLPKGVLNDPAYYGMGAEEIYAARQQQARKEKEKQAQQGAGQPQAGGTGQGAPQNAQQPPSAGAGQPQGQQGANGQPQPGNASGASPQGTSNGNGGKPEKGAYGIGGIMQPGSEAECTAEADKWDILAREAAAIAKRANAGTMPQFVERIIREAETPAIDVAEILSRYIDSTIATDYSFSRPNRRLIGHGFYLPGAVADALDHLVFAVDTSGSIDRHMLSVCSRVIMDAVETGKVNRVTVIFADAKVQRVQAFERGDDMDLRPLGGGGTDFRDTFDVIARDHSDATAVVYLTDMITSDFGDDPGIPVLWAVHGDSRQTRQWADKAPFGEVAYVGRLE